MFEQAKYDEVNAVVVQEAAAVAASWKAVVDEGTGKTYYWNTVTGTTSGTLPTTEEEQKEQVHTRLAEQWSTMDNIARGSFLTLAQSKLDAMLKSYVQLFADTATRLGVAFSEDDRACVEIAFRMLIEQRGLKQIDTWLNDGSEKQFAEPDGGGSSGTFGSSGGFGAMSFDGGGGVGVFGGGGAGSHQVSGQI